MAVPVVPTTPYVPGNIPTASDFNTFIRNAINYFVNPPRAIAKNTTGTITRTATATWQLMTWNNQVDDTDAIYDPAGTHPERMIIVTPGRYHVWLNCVWENHNVQPYDGDRGIQIRKNSGGLVTGGDIVAVDHRASNSNPNTTYSATQQGCDGYFSMAATDYFECFAYDTDDDTVLGSPVGCYLDTTRHNSHRFGVQWVSI